MNDELVFVVKDVFDRDVSLYSTELKHISEGHAELENEIEAIKNTIVDPEFIYKSKRYENREVFFKQGSHSNPSYNKLYTKAVVEYVENTGKITTAFLCKDIQGVDERGIKYVNINNKL